MEAPTLERKLVAILAADAVGYSPLMEQDEAAALATLTARRTIIDGPIARFRGRIAGTAGDSVLAEFASVFDAVECAVRIQKTSRPPTCLFPTMSACRSGSASTSAT